MQPYFKATVFASIEQQLMHDFNELLRDKHLVLSKTQLAKSKDPINSKESYYVEDIDPDAQTFERKTYGRIYFKNGEHYERHILMCVRFLNEEESCIQFKIDSSKCERSKINTFLQQIVDAFVMLKTLIEVSESSSHLWQSTVPPSS